LTCLDYVVAKIPGKGIKHLMRSNILPQATLSWRTRVTWMHSNLECESTKAVLHRDLPLLDHVSIRKHLLSGSLTRVTWMHSNLEWESTKPVLHRDLPLLNHLSIRKHLLSGSLKMHLQSSRTAKDDDNDQAGYKYYIYPSI
jgi:hypothetical protein